MARQIGLKDIHIAVLTKDDSTGVTYSTPEKLERSIAAKLTPKTASEKLYSDDSVEEVINSFDSIDVEIEINQLSLESRAKLQGAKLYKGTLLENKNNIAPVIALGFKSKKTNGKYRFIWLYKGTFDLTSDDFNAEEDKLKSQTAKLKGTFYSRDFDGNYRFIADEDATGVDANIIKNWFAAVQEQPTVTP